jgi:ribosomal protein S12 methylthiotransferase accessory factor
MDIQVTFPGGKRVDAAFGSHRVATDQPREGGGEDAAPAPFDLFLASLATCAGIYVLGFCQARGIPIEGFRITQTNDVDPETHLPRRIELTIAFPPDFPEKYKPAALRAAENCKVKKVIAAKPELVVRAA